MLLVLGAMFAFSLMAVFTREAGASVAGVAAWRALFVTVVFAVAAVAREGGITALTRPSRDTAVLGGFLGLALALASATFVGGYAFTTVANTIFLHNLAPVVVFPLAWKVYQERPSASALAGAGIALVGVALLSGVSFFQVAHFANPRFLLGDGLALLSAVGYGLVLVLTGATRKAGTPILSTLAIAWGVAAVLLVGIALATGTFALTWSALAWTFGLAVICTNLPFTLLNLGMREVKAGTAAVLSLSEVIFATAIGMLVYGESLAPVGWMGGLLATLGVLYAVTQDADAHEASDTSTAWVMPEAAARPRAARLGIAVLALNVGAVLSLLGHGGGAAVLAWGGLAWTARLGPGLAASSLPERQGRWLGWAGAAVGGVAVAGALLRGAGEFREGSLLVAILAIAFAVADQALAAQEPHEVRDRAPLVGGGLVILAVATAFASISHPSGPFLARGAAICVAMGALSAVLASIRGTLVRGGPDAYAHTEGRLLRPVTPGRVGGVVVLAWALGGVTIVPVGHQGIVERFGAPLEALAEPGLLLRMPPPLESVRLVDVAKVRRLPVLDAGTTLLCGDQSMVSLQGVLHYRVSDARKFAYSAIDIDPTLHALARGSLTEAVSRRTHDAVLTTGRAELEIAAMQRTQERADAVGLGVEVVDVNFANAAVPPPVLQAFLDVISADEKRLTVINLAEAHAARVLPKAGGQAVARLAEAASEAARIAAHAEGRHALHLALSRTGPASPLTLERLRLEALEATLKPRRLIVVPDGVHVWSANGVTLPPSPLHAEPSR